MCKGWKLGAKGENIERSKVERLSRRENDRTPRSEIISPIATATAHASRPPPLHFLDDLRPNPPAEPESQSSCQSAEVHATQDDLSAWRWPDWRAARRNSRFTHRRFRMCRYSLLLCLLAEVGDSLDLDHGFWGLGSDLLFQEVTHDVR